MSKPEIRRGDGDRPAPGAAEDVRRRARLTVAANATDADDLSLLLDVLGLTNAAPDAAR